MVLGYNYRKQKRRRSPQESIESDIVKTSWNITFWGVLTHQHMHHVVGGVLVVLGQRQLSITLGDDWLLTGGLGVHNIEFVQPCTLV